MCVVQDRISRKLIGAGERRDGLYYFRKVPSMKAFKTNGIGSLDLWHKRLGHPSSKIIKLVPNVNIDKDSDLLTKACGACQRAKHTRTVIINRLIFLNLFTVIYGGHTEPRHLVVLLNF